MKGTLRWLALSALIAAAYYAGGWLGLLLAIPPGYATAVFPAAGIALGAVMLAGHRVAPGVWAGAFLLNLPTALRARGLGLGEFLPHLVGGEQSLWGVVVVPAVVALGATLQAMCGASLVRRRVGRAALLEQDTDVIPVLLLGGPLSCLVSASIGVGILSLAGQLDADGVAANWSTWWVGDSIGVLVFTPLLLLWAQGPWRTGFLARLAVSAVMVVLLTVVVSLFVVGSRRENDRLREEFDRASESLVAEIDTRFEHAGLALAALRGLFEGESRVNRRAFEGIASTLSEYEPDVRALSWNPLVPDADVPALVAAGRADYGAGYSLHGFAGRAPPAMHVPVRFIAPLSRNAPALGLDIASDLERSRVLDIAAATDRISLSAPIVLLQDPEQLPGVLLVEPVRASSAVDPDQRLRGYAVAALRAQDLLKAPARRLELRHIHLVVTDVDTPADGHPALYTSPQRLEPGGFAREQILSVGGRRWRLVTHLPDSALLARRSWQTWGFLAAGLLFTGLLGMFLLVLVGRGRRVALLVESRTSELRSSNTELARELIKGDKLQAETHRRAADLVAANHELEQFAYIVSHDLQAPLRSIGSFAGLLERKAGEQLDDRSREYLSLIRDGVGEMQKLIEALLRMSRISRGRPTMSVVQMNSLMERVREVFQADLESQQAELVADDLPVVHGDPDLLTQVLQNLVGNALKFHRPGVPARVRVSGGSGDSEWRFSVSDNGTGLSPQNVDRLFQVFRRFHAASQYPGTGIGLAVSRKIVQLHGGRIWAESELGQGTTFHFTLPMEQAAQEP